MKLSRYLPGWIVDLAGLLWGAFWLGAFIAFWIVYFEMIKRAIQ